MKNPDDPEHFMRKMSDFRKNIYVDTHSMSGASIEAACNILGEDYILFGSDYPITPAGFGRGHGLSEIGKIVSGRREKILGENMMALYNR